MMEMNAETFNSTFSVGDDVIYTDDFGVEHKTKTRSPAWELGHGTTVVSVHGKAGGYDVARIKSI